MKIKLLNIICICLCLLSFRGSFASDSSRLGLSVGIDYLWGEPFSGFGLQIGSPFFFETKHASYTLHAVRSVGTSVQYSTVELEVHSRLFGEEQFRVFGHLGFGPIFSDRYAGDVLRVGLVSEFFVDPKGNFPIFLNAIFSFTDRQREFSNGFGLIAGIRGYFW